MPRWARFVSCGLTGLLLALGGFLTVAYWWEGGHGFWQACIDFIATPGFWSIVSLFGLLIAGALVFARIIIHVYGMTNGLAGLIAGSLVALAYAAFLVAIHADDWGGVSVGLRRIWPGLALFMLPFALVGGFMSWLWDRLD